MCTDLLPCARPCQSHKDDLDPAAVSRAHWPQLGLGEKRGSWGHRHRQAGVQRDSGCASEERPPLHIATKGSFQAQSEGGLSVLEESTASCHSWRCPGGSRPVVGVTLNLAAPDPCSLFVCGHMHRDRESKCLLTRCCLGQGPACVMLCSLPPQTHDYG